MTITMTRPGSLLLAIGVLGVILFGVSACSNGDDKPVRATMRPDGTQTVKVLVQHGYHPRIILAKAGIPLTVYFMRKEPPGHSCDQELTIPDAKIEKMPLPIGENKRVILAARPKGSEVAFECGMQMLHGKVRYVP